MDSVQLWYSPAVCTVPGPCHPIATCIQSCRLSLPTFQTQGSETQEVSHLPQASARACLRPVQCDFPLGLPHHLCLAQPFLQCSVQKSSRFTAILPRKSFPSHLCETDLRDSWNRERRLGAGRGGAGRPSQSHTAMRNMSGLWF